MKKLAILLLLLPLMTLLRAAGAENMFSMTVPETVRPYAVSLLEINAPESGMLSLTLEDDYLYDRFLHQEVEEGSTILEWDGLITAGQAPQRGRYTVRACLEGTSGEYECTLDIRIGSPAAALQYCIPSADTVYAGQEGFLVNYLMTVGGEIMYVRLSEADMPDMPIKTWSREVADDLPHIFSWDGTLGGIPVPEGDYVLTFSVKNSPQEPFAFPLQVRADAPEELPVTLTDPALFLPEEGSDIWECLMQPVTVVDIGLLQHQNILSAPDSASSVLGTLHGGSHGVMVLEESENGFARIGTWRQEDGEYVEGYVPVRKLKTVVPNAHYGLVVDKNSQTMSVWQNGEMLGEIPVSTGLIAKNKLFRETLAGAFLTTDRSVSFRDEGYQYNYILRIDGGNLIHSLGCHLREGKFDYSEQMAMLGQKASHGCIRTDTRAGENGLNIYWLWTHIPYHTKVLVLDDPENRAAQTAALMTTATPAATKTAEPVTRLPAESPAPSEAPDPTVLPTPEADPTPTPEPAYEGLIGFRARGVRVMQLQERLRELGYYTEEIDGMFGTATYQAVLDFQRVNRLSADGIVGEKTYAALYGEEALSIPTPSPTAVITPSPAPSATSVPTPDPTASPTELPTPEPPEETTIVITLAGDALLGSEDQLRRKENSFDSVVQARGLDYPLQNFADLFFRDDVTSLNLECVLKDNSRDKTEGRLYNFRGPTAFTGILTSASVEHVNIANNHYIDYGYTGRSSTRQALSDAGISFSGYTYTWIFEKDGIRIGFGGIRETVWKQDNSLPAREIRELRDAGCDFILYCCHFGTEYEQTHNDLQTRIAHAVIDAGADCVVGTHPHVVQGAELYNGRPVFYSLGNFVFGGNLSPSDYDGLAVQLVLHFSRGQFSDGRAVLIPLMTSGVQNGTTDFCPVIAEGKDRTRILQRIFDDSPADTEETILF